MKQELINVLNNHNIEIALLNNTVGEITFGVLNYINADLRSKLTSNDKDISLILSYDFSDVKDFIGRLNEALPLMKEKGLI